LVLGAWCFAIPNFSVSLLRIKLSAKWQQSYLHSIGSKSEARNPKLETISNDPIFPPWRDHKQESFGILHFENSSLFRISIFEFRIFRLRTLVGSGFTGLAVDVFSDGRKAFPQMFFSMGFDREDRNQFEL